MLKAYGAAERAQGFETHPTKGCCSCWTVDPDNGLVTAAFKIRRKFINDEYRKEIDATYNE